MSIAPKGDGGVNGETIRTRSAGHGVSHFTWWDLTDKEDENPA